MRLCVYQLSDVAKASLRELTLAKSIVINEALARIFVAEATPVLRQDARVAGRANSVVVRRVRYISGVVCTWKL